MVLPFHDKLAHFCSHKIWLSAALRDRQRRRRVGLGSLGLGSLRNVVQKVVGDG